MKCRETASVGQPNYSSPATHSKPSGGNQKKTRSRREGTGKRGREANETEEQANTDRTGTGRKKPIREKQEQRRREEKGA